MPIVAVLALAVLATAPVQTAPVCSEGPAPVPAELAGWQAMTPVTAASDATAAPTLAIGQGASVRLAAGTTVRLAHPVEKAATPSSFGGLLAITIARAGRYRIALGGSAWIDVVAGTRALPSVAHDHGPACSPIRKMVDFDLAPGRYLVQVAGAKAPTLPLIVASVKR